MLAILDTLMDYSHVLHPIIFFGFFFVTGVAILLNRNESARRTYATGLVLVLLLFQISIVPFFFPPFMAWHKFSKTWDQERVEYEFRMVDANGREVKFDEKSTLAFETVRMVTLHDEMVNDYSAEKNEEIGRWLLESARTYRVDVMEHHPPRGLVWTDGGIQLRYLTRFPAHGHVATWTPAELRQYDEFVGIRQYQMTIVTSEDGSEVVSYSEEMTFEYIDPEYRDTELTHAENETATEMRNVH